MKCVIVLVVMATLALTSLPNPAESARQSPINLNRLSAISQKKVFGALQYINYDVKYWCSGNLTLSNNGYTIQIDVPQIPIGMARPYIEGGGLGARYFVRCVVFHWGSTANQGSEHSENGKTYAAEMQIVHIKESYDSIEEAQASGDRTAFANVAALIHGKGLDDNPKYADIISLLPFVKKKIVVENYTTDATYNYRDIGLDLTTVSAVTFSVKACNDVHVALGTIPGDFNNGMYELVIGGWGNSQSVIRRCQQCDNLVTISLSLLDCSEFRNFWIKWSGNVIRIGTGLTPDVNKFIEYNDPEPYSLPIRYIGISTGWGATGEWVFPRENAQMLYGFPLKNLLPDDATQFYRYEGSSTTTPYAENVIWTVLKKTYFLSANQLDKFRELLYVDGTPMVDNYRPRQNLDGRVVYKNF